ncbi:MAG TPA: class I SAM-dependent RNA methyltransferase [Terriglobia bacterium]|nr:class I SAM-dependent RNA methyltransferase [Terriglobia bacterium]
MSSFFEFSPVKLVYGGEALGFQAGRTVLAPRVLPGERAEVEEVRRQKGVVHARPLRILEPSSERVEPLCPYFGRCGGCQYQHLPHAAQIAAKVEILRETLRRLGKVKWEEPIPAHSGPAWNYRTQAQLKVGKPADGAPALGFFEAQSNRLIPIDACPILSPRLNALLAVLRSEPWINALANGREVELLADDRDEKVMLTLAGGWNAQEAETLARKCLAELAGVATVAVVQDASVRVFGDPHLTYRVGEFAYRISPTAFFQSSRSLLPELVAGVVAPGFSPADAGPSPCSGQALKAGATLLRAGEPGGVAIDLFAGVGLFTLPLANRFEQVIGVEAHPQAAADLAANARAVPGKEIRAIAGTAFDFLRRCAQMDPDLVVMDPPRAGVGADTLKLLLALQPKHLHYVSCSPPTLARDLGFMLQHGYRLDSLELFDCFPQTYHIESLARLSPVGRERA